MTNWRCWSVFYYISNFCISTFAFSSPLFAWTVFDFNLEFRLLFKRLQNQHCNIVAQALLLDHSVTVRPNWLAIAKKQVLVEMFCSFIWHSACYTALDSILICALMSAVRLICLIEKRAAQPTLQNVFPQLSYCGIFPYKFLKFCILYVL